MGDLTTWPRCLSASALVPRILESEPTKDVMAFMTPLHLMAADILLARKVRDQETALGEGLFRRKITSTTTKVYPYMQLFGPLPPLGITDFDIAPVCPTSWPWDTDFRDALAGWLRGLTRHDNKEDGTVTFMELALDFEAFAGRGIPPSPQAIFRGVTLPLQERARVLRMALNELRPQVTRGHLHPGTVINRANSLVPLGGPTASGISRRPYFSRRDQMLPMIRDLATYCETKWQGRLGSLRRQRGQPPRRRLTDAERFVRAMEKSVSQSLMPAQPPKSSKGGAGRPGQFGVDYYPQVQRLRGQYRVKRPRDPQAANLPNRLPRADEQGQRQPEVVHPPHR